MVPSAEYQKTFVADNIGLLDERGKQAAIDMVREGLEVLEIDLGPVMFDEQENGRPEVNIDLDVLGDVAPQVLLWLFIATKRRRDELSKPRIE